LLSLIVYALLGKIFSHFGLAVAKNINEISGLTSFNTQFGIIPSKIIHLLNAYLSLLGANPSRIQSNYWLIPVVIFNLGIVCLAVSSLYHFVRKHQFSLLNIWLFASIFFTFIYLLLVSQATPLTIRYLIVLIPITALLAIHALERLAQGKRLHYQLATGFAGLAILLNLIQGSILIYQTRQLTRPNNMDYQIIAALEKNGVTKSYGNYWVANISYYLSDYKYNVLPTKCSLGGVYLYPTLLDGQRFNEASQKIGVIVIPQLIVKTLNNTLQAPSCTLKNTIKQFGIPQKIILVTPSVDLLIYNHSLTIQSWT